MLRNHFHKEQDESPERLLEPDRWPVVAVWPLFMDILPSRSGAHLKDNVHDLPATYTA